MHPVRLMIVLVVSVAWLAIVLLGHDDPNSIRCNHVEFQSPECGE